MKLNLLLKFWFLITIKLTAAGSVCDPYDAMISYQTELYSNEEMCDKLSDNLYDCLLRSTYRHHSYYSCFVCTIPNCKKGVINCGRESFTKELHWSFDIFEAGFYMKRFSTAGFIKIVLNNKIFHKIELLTEGLREKIIITLKECKFTNEEKEDCIENRSEVHENLDPRYSCIFLAIGYQNASTINFVTIHNCSRVATSFISAKNVYSLKRPIENFVKRFMKKITIYFYYDQHHAFDGIPVILPCGPGGFIYLLYDRVPCNYVFPEYNTNQGIGYYYLFYEDGFGKLQARPSSITYNSSYFDENGMKYNDSMMMLFENPDYKFDANKYINGCLIKDRPKTTKTIKITTTTTLTTSTVTELQTNLTSTIVEKPIPDIVIPTVSIGEFSSPVKENVQVTLKPLPVITIGNATLIRNISSLNKLNLTAFVEAVGPDSLHPSYLLSEMNPNDFLIPLKNKSLVDVSQYQLSSPEKVKKKKKSSSQTGATDTFSSGTKSLVIILNKCNLLLLFLKVL